MTAMNNFMPVDQSTDSVEMFFINDLSIIRILKRMSAELKLNLFFDFSDKSILDRSVTADIIRCDACLSTVQIFSENNSSGCKLQICRFINDTGAFTAELKCYRSKMCRSFFHDFFTDILTSGEKNIVKMFFQQTGVFGASAGNDSCQFRRKAFAYHI